MSPLSAAEAATKQLFLKQILALEKIKKYIILRQDPGLSIAHVTFLALVASMRVHPHIFASMYLVWTNAFVKEQDILCQYVSLLVQ